MLGESIHTSTCHLLMDLTKSFGVHIFLLVLILVILVSVHNHS